MLFLWSLFFEQPNGATFIPIKKRGGQGSSEDFDELPGVGWVFDHENVLKYCIPQGFLLRAKDLDSFQTLSSKVARLSFFRDSTRSSSFSGDISLIFS